MLKSASLVAGDRRFYIMHVDHEGYALGGRRKSSRGVDEVPPGRSTILTQIPGAEC